MASRSGVRSRRTRVYDCNYNMGESYYRPALDRLDRKATGRSEQAEAPPTVARDLEERYRTAFADEDLNSARKRAEKVISEETMFDSRGGRSVRGRPLSTAMEEAENDFDEEVNNSLRRLRANKKKSLFLDDVDMESTVANLHNRSRLGLAEKIMESAGLSEGTETRRRIVARVSTTNASSASTSERDERDVGARWTAIEDGNAAARARASRARLADLEEETNAIVQRQAVRDRRAADLRSFLAEERIERAF